MAIKEKKADAAEQRTAPALDKDSRKRLEKIQGEWDKPQSRLSEKLTVADLRLLLEHHLPLQDLIRAIAQNWLEDAALPSEGQTAPLHPQKVQAEAAEQAAAAAQAQAQVQTLTQQCQALQSDLTQCSAATQKLLQEKAATQQAQRQLEKQLQQAQKELAATRNELTRMGGAAAEVRLLQTDVALARRLDLADLPDDATQALVRVVAVLAQRDNLERLWTALKERCESENRPANSDERALLAAALSWYNHNWRSKPYQPLTPAPNSAYDFERHLRSQHTSAGEKIADLRLPGVADGSGRLLCKALVSTR
jgi:hypothetical protein